jgi:lysozyme
MSFFTALLSLFGKPAPTLSDPAPVAVPVHTPVPVFEGGQRTSAAGRALIQGKESCRLVAYPDPKTGGAPWTCGWGETEGVTPTTVWTQAEADSRFERSLAKVEALVRHYVTAPMTQGQFDAFVSIFYNVGPGSEIKDGIGRLRNGEPSTLLRKFNAGDLAGTEAEWVKWISPGSSVSHGLYLRRVAELELFKS